MRTIRLLATACVLAALTLSSNESNVQWKPVPGLELEGHTGLSAVVAFGRDQVWVGGYEHRYKTVTGDKAVLARWDGVRWTKTRLGGRFLAKTLAGTGPDDLWVTNEGQLDGDTVASSAFRWNGKGWTEDDWVGASSLVVHGIAADGDQVTLVGSDHGRPAALTRDRQGARLARGWYGMFSSVTAAAGHTWIAGAKPNMSCTQTFPAIWHRPRPDVPFEEVAVPAPPYSHLRAITQDGPADVWAVGGSADQQTVTIGWRSEVLCEPQSLAPALPDATSPKLWPLVLHWNGEAWRRVQLPGWQGTLVDVAVSPQTGVWAAGADPARPNEVMILHYDGSWTREYVRTGSVRGLDLAVVDGVPWIVGGNDQPFVLRRSR